MTRFRFLRQGLTVFDVIFITGIALVPILAWRGIRLTELGLLPLILAPFLWRRVAPDRNDWLTICLFAQYALLVTVNVLVYPVTPGATGDVGPKAALYAGSIVTLALMILRFRMALDVGRLWRVVGPVAVLFSIGLLGWDHLRLPAPDSCRVGFLSKHLLIPPLWLTVFAVASYHGWARMAPWERWVRHLALALVIVATVAFSGGRAMLVAQAVTIPILSLLLGWAEPVGRRVRIVAVLGLVSVAGFAGGLALDIRSGCEFAERLVAVFSTFQRGEEAETLAVKTFADKFEGTEEEAQITEAPGDATASTKLDRDARLVGAVYIRPLLWAQALERIREAPLLGYGMLNEPALINGDFPHYHEQYLSWLIWGGPLMLISGLVMLFAPLVTFAPRRSQDGAILTLAMIAPIAVSFLAATNLLHTVMLLGYVMTLGLLHALARERLRAERPKPERGGVSTETGYMGRV